MGTELITILFTVFSEIIVKHSLLFGDMSFGISPKRA